MSRPSFLRVGDVAVPVDQIQYVAELGDHKLTAWFSSAAPTSTPTTNEYVELPITLDQFEEILRDAGREVATIEDAS